MKKQTSKKYGKNKSHHRKNGRVNNKKKSNNKKKRDNMNTMGDIMDSLKYRDTLCEMLETSFNGLRVIDRGMGLDNRDNVFEIYVEYEYMGMTHRISVMKEGINEPSYFEVMRGIQ
jgi:hypothetical protein